MNWSFSSRSARSSASNASGAFRSDFTVGRAGAGATAGGENFGGLAAPFRACNRYFLILSMLGYVP